MIIFCFVFGRWVGCNPHSQTCNKLATNLQLIASAERRFDALVNEFEEILSHIREREVNDSVCGISRQAAIDAVLAWMVKDRPDIEMPTDLVGRIAALPSAQSESCEGCKHLGKWKNEVEYGYPSPCTRCKRRAEDHYER